MIDVLDIELIGAKGKLTAHFRIVHVPIACKYVCGAEVPIKQKLEQRRLVTLGVGRWHGATEEAATLAGQLQNVWVATLLALSIGCRCRLWLVGRGSLLIVLKRLTLIRLISLCLLLGQSLRRRLRRSHLSLIMACLVHLIWVRCTLLIIWTISNAGERETAGARSSLLTASATLLILCVKFLKMFFWRLLMLH